MRGATLSGRGAALVFSLWALGSLGCLGALGATGCSDNRTTVSPDAGGEHDGGRERTEPMQSDEDSGSSDPTTVISGEDASDDTGADVTGIGAFVDGGPDGGHFQGQPTRPTFLPDERPPQTAALVEPDPVEINVGDTVPAVAVRLARFIWRSEPDAVTVDLARRGKLSSAEEVYEEAQRLLADARAERGYLSFFGAWAEFAQTATIDSGLTAASGSDAGIGDAGSRASFFDGAARAEFETYVLQLVTSGAKLKDLVHQSFEVTEPTLLELFNGEPAVVRAGVFTQPYLLAAGSLPERPSPSRRGAFIARRLLCEDVTLPEIHSGGELPAGDTVRHWVTDATADGDCAACHSKIDPLGFALDSFDAHGRGRSTEAGAAIDTSADLSALALPNADGPDELGISLLYARNALPCVLSQWFQYALQRDLGDAENASWIDLVRGSEFYTLQEIPALIAATPAFWRDDASELPEP